MNAFPTTLPVTSICASGRTARRPLAVAATTAPGRRADGRRADPSHEDREPLDDLLFGCSALALMAMPLILATTALLG